MLCPVEVNVTSLWKGVSWCVALLSWQIRLMSQSVKNCGSSIQSSLCCAMFQSRPGCCPCRISSLVLTCFVSAPVACKLAGRLCFVLVLTNLQSLSLSLVSNRLSGHCPEVRESSERGWAAGLHPPEESSREERRAAVLLVSWVAEQREKRSKDWAFM